MTRPLVARRLVLGAIGYAGVAGLFRSAHAQAQWDGQPETRATSAVAPKSILSGSHYSLSPTVTIYAYLNRYAVNSDFGPFVAPSDARLRRLIREIVAIAALKQIQQSNAFAQASLEAGKSSLRSARSLIEDPVNTLSAIPEGIGSIFDRVAEQVQRSGRSKYEDGAAKEMLAVSSFKRELAAKLGVDVYSSNEVLQRELNRVAWASAAGNLTLGAVSMATGAIALKVASNVRLVEQARNLVEATPPSELSRRNRDQLRRMRVPDATMSSFLRNAMLSPRHQTIVVASMAALGDVPGRADFITYAAQADTEDEALLFQQMAELMASYSASVAAVRRIEIVSNLPVARDARGAAILLLPIDRLLWTERNAAISASLARSLSASSARRAPEIWMTGDASPRAEAGLKGSGLALTERCGARLPLLD